MKDAAVKAVPGVSEEMVGYSLLPDTMLTKQQIRWKANRIKDGTYAALSAALPLASVEQAGRSSAEPVTCIKELIDSLREGVRPEGGMQGEVELFDIDGANQIMDEAAEALSAIAHPGAGQPAAARAQAAIAEQMDDLSPEESIGAFDGSGTWREVCTVAEFRKLTASGQPAAAAVEALIKIVNLSEGHDELERARKIANDALAALASGNDLRAENAALKARVSELEGALEQCSDARTELTSNHDYSRGWNDALFRVRQIARSTLSRTKKEPSDAG